MILVEVGNGQLPTFFVGFWRQFPPHFYHTTIPSLNGGGGVFLPPLFNDKN
jgi:hypothetical protein